MKSIKAIISELDEQGASAASAVAELLTNTRPASRALLAEEARELAGWAAFAARELEPGETPDLRHHLKELIAIMDQDAFRKAMNGAGLGYVVELAAAAQAVANTEGA